MFRLMTEGAGAKPREGHISTFQAFCVSTASRVGVGNIAGIAIAVATGGPGAVFWMWVIATIGAASGFVESTLAQIYKAPRKGGGFVGGPAYYIGNVIGSSFFASVFAVLLAVTYGLIFNSVQANTISLSMQTSFGFDTQMTGLAIAGFTALVIFGGFEALRAQDAFNILRPDVVIFDVLGDVVCGGFAMPIRDGWARNVFIITSGENMAIHAAANIATAVETFAERGYARLGGIILNARDVPREAAKVEELACDLNTTIVGRLPRSAEVQEADALGLTVLEHAPSSGTC